MQKHSYLVRGTRKDIMCAQLKKVIREKKEGKVEGGRYLVKRTHFPVLFSLLPDPFQTRINK